MAKKKAKVTSIETTVRVFSAADTELRPPKHIKMLKSDMPFFRSIIAEFSRAEWTEHSLELAALLARAMNDYEHEQWKLREEGTVVKSDKGTPVINPRKSLIQMSAGIIFNTRRTLALHARAQHGEPRDQIKRTNKNLATEDLASGFDDLIPRPDGITH